MHDCAVACTRCWCAWTLVHHFTVALAVHIWSMRVQVVIADIDEAAARQAAERLSLEGVTAFAIRCDVSVREEVRESVS